MKGYSYNTGRRKPLLQFKPGETWIRIGCRSFGYRYCSIAWKVYSHNTGRRKPLLQIHQGRRAFQLAVSALATGQEHGRYTYSNSTGRRKPLLQFHQVIRAFLLSVSALGHYKKYIGTSLYSAPLQSDGIILMVDSKDGCVTLMATYVINLHLLYQSKRWYPAVPVIYKIYKNNCSQ